MAFDLSSYYKSDIFILPTDGSIDPLSLMNFTVLLLREGYAESLAAKEVYPEGSPKAGILRVTLYINCDHLEKSAEWSEQISRRAKEYRLTVVDHIKLREHLRVAV